MSFNAPSTIVSGAASAPVSALKHLRADITARRSSVADITTSAPLAQNAKELHAPPVSERSSILEFNKKALGGMVKQKTCKLDEGAISASKRAAHETSQFLLKSLYRNPLTAWLHSFDRDGNEKIDFHEFEDGMKALAYEGSVLKLWKDLDIDGSGELSLDEIDQESADMWSSFRRWCATKFVSAKDMVSQLGKKAQDPVRGPYISLDAFSEQMAALGWKGQFEKTLFESMDKCREGKVYAPQLKWHESERKKLKRREMSKMRAQGMAELKARGTVLAARSLADFKAFIKKKYGHPFRAWRKCLDADGSMTVQRAELFKACREMSWKGDVRALWKALDTDDSGGTAIEELDPNCARVLAQFKTWADQRWGGMGASFRALDRRKGRRMKKEDFLDGCKHFGWTLKCKTIFLWLDWEDKKYITENDVVFMDDWKPPEWLMAQPNKDAADEMKRLLMRRYKHLLKAWRIALDRDNSNRCSWHEFQEGAKRIHFSGDIAGAWLYFDEDLSGYITLAELDIQACEVLLEFKQWADKEFGGVRSSFQVLDADGSGELSFREFRRAARDFGFTGECRALFQCLDTDHTGSLALNEVSFLDEWEDDQPGEDSGDARVEKETTRTVEHGEDLVAFVTCAPGPGKYNVSRGLGVMPRYAGSASYGKPFSSTLSCPMGRPGTWPAIQTATPRRKKAARSSLVSQLEEVAEQAPVGPGSYDPQIPGTFRETDKSRPWGFGRAKRKMSFDRTEYTGLTPGPGSYDAQKLAHHSPQFSIVPRRATSGNVLKGEKKAFQESYTSRTIL